MTVAYRIDPDEPSKAFVRMQPRGAVYLRTHTCVVFVACPHCKAPVGAPCQSAHDSPKIVAHIARRNAYRMEKRR